VQQIDLYAYLVKSKALGVDVSEDKLSKYLDLTVHNFCIKQIKGVFILIVNDDLYEDFDLFKVTKDSVVKLDFNRDDIKDTKFAFIMTLVDSFAIYFKMCEKTEFHAMPEPVVLSMEYKLNGKVIDNKQKSINICHL
jgi:hypothetical protein